MVFLQRFRPFKNMHSVGYILLHEMVIDSARHGETVLLKNPHTASIPGERSNQYFTYVHAGNGPLIQKCVNGVCHDSTAMMTRGEKVYTFGERRLLKTDAIHTSETPQDIGIANGKFIIGSHVVLGSLPIDFSPVHQFAVSATDNFEMPEVYICPILLNFTDGSHRATTNSFEFLRSSSSKEFLECGIVYQGVPFNHFFCVIYEMVFSFSR